MFVTLRATWEGYLPRGQRCLVFSADPPASYSGAGLVADQAPLPVVGAIFGGQQDGGRLQVVGKFRWTGESADQPAIECCWLQALDDTRLDSRARSWTVEKNGYSLAWITLSDKGYVGKREDQAGPLIAELIRPILKLVHVQGHLLPDEPSRLRALLVELSLEQGIDLILTTGGTGVGPRDVTPETMLSIIEKRLPGMETAMLQAALFKTGHAVISRAVVGILGKSLIINLPGSPKAVRENLGVLLPALDHTLAKLHGDSADCAQAC